ncbi:MAG: small mechanosensitive ion channel protein MscS, partial [Frankiales bacterium]|nr:small mechanosensitive ion channel protein MscS [Frankiales bacterium]
MSEKRRRRIPRSAAQGRVLGRDALLTLDAKIKPDFKRAVGAGVLAIVCLGVGDNLGGVHRTGQIRFVALGLVIAFVVFGVGAVRSAA